MIMIMVSKAMLRINHVLGARTVTLSVLAALALKIMVKNSGNSPMLQHVSPSPFLLCRCLTFSSAELRKRRRVEIEQKREKDLQIVLSITTLTFFLLHLPRSDIIDIIGDVATNDSNDTGLRPACMRQSGCLLSSGGQLSFNTHLN